MSEVSAAMNADFTTPLKQQNPRAPIQNQQDKSTKHPLSSALDMNEPKKQSIEIDSAHPTISSGPDSTYDATSKQIAFQHNITLLQEDINSISSILQFTFEAKLELMIRSVMESSVQHILDGVLVGLSARVAVLEHKNNELPVQNKKLASENDLLRSRLVKLEAASDNQEQYSRLNCIRITCSGIPETPNNMNTDAVVADLCKDIGVILDSNARLFRYMAEKFQKIK